MEAVLQLGYDIAKSEEDTIAQLQKSNSGGAPSPNRPHQHMSPEGQKNITTTFSHSAKRSTAPEKRNQKLRNIGAYDQPANNNSDVSFAATKVNTPSPIAGQATKTINRSVMCKVPGHTPKSDADGFSGGSTSKGKFSRLPKSPPKKVLYCLYVTKILHIACRSHFTC